jgi:hypothetical protein
MSTKKAMPTKQEVLEYAKPLLRKFISENAADLPYEHKQEIEQSGYLRILSHYDVIDAGAGWKSFVYNHCRGAVLDYLKAGHGFQENRWTIAKQEGKNSRFKTKIRERVSVVNSDDESLGIDALAGLFGIFDELDLPRIEIRWELVAKMASQDKVIHAFAKHILGQTIEQIAPTFGKERARAGQMVQAFIARFDDSSQLTEKNRQWFLQTCYAFGLCGILGLEDIDQGVAHTLEPVDLELVCENPEQFGFSFGDDTDA